MATIWYGPGLTGAGGGTFTGGGLGACAMAGASASAARSTKPVATSTVEAKNGCRITMSPKNEP